MNINELQDMWEADCVIDDNYLGEQATSSPKLHAKYLRLLVNAKLKHTKMKSDYNTLRKNKFRYYRGELSRDELIELDWPQWQGVKPLKNEMDEFLTGDTDLIALDNKVQYIAVMVETIESIMAAIKNREWSIKSGIEWKKFLAGM